MTGGPGRRPGPGAASEDPIEGVRREFADGLGARLRKLSSALDELAERFDEASAEGLYHEAHSLKGTAASFGADELVGPAARLAVLAHGWRRSSTVLDEERPAARGALKELEVAIAAYCSRAGRGWTE